jgi:leucine dehydrogenase
MIKKVPTKHLEKFKEFDCHESVYYVYDRPTGLKGYISIHNTKLGSATGGTRFWPYKEEEGALKDALNLSHAMTHKCALADVPFGGGKAAIISHDGIKDKKALMRAYAKEINSLKGKFTTGEDVGIDENDIREMSKVSSHIVGIPGKDGDPSPWAALGVFSAIEQALHEVSGSKKMNDKTFSIKGLGKVGMELCRLISKKRGRLIVADIDTKKTNYAKNTFKNIKVVPPEQIHKEKVDVYSPCAMGNEFNQKNVGELRCKIVCGSANNQLCDESIGNLFLQKRILYIPDYVANAGGLINVTDSQDAGGYNRKRVQKKTKAIAKTVKKIVALSKLKKQATNKIANLMVKEKIGRQNYGK